MRVGLNLLYLVPGRVGGVETFGREIVNALASLGDRVTDYIVFTSLDAADLRTMEQDRFRIIVLPFHANRRTVRYFWEQLVLPFVAWREKIDVLHSLSYVGPVLCPMPTIVTVHDANTSILGATMTWYRRLGLSTLSRIASRTSDLVTTVSEFSRRELIRWYKLNPAAVRVVLSGPGRQAESASETSPRPLSEIGNGEPYIAVIGGSYPHKNILRLIEAFARVERQVPHKLVILGNLAADAYDALLHLGSDRIVIAGYVSDAQLRETIRLSDLFVMPSLYEGFGFPVLEAQLQCVPVACSNRGSLPEVVGQSARLFDPENVEEIAKVMLECVLDRELNRSLRERARLNVERFSWQRAAQEYRDCYRQVLERRIGKQPFEETIIRPLD